MAVLTTQKIARSGLTPSMGSAAGGDEVTPGDTTFLMVSNANGSSINVTITPGGTNEYGASKPTIVVAVANATTKLIGPLDRKVQASNRRVAISWSATSGVTRAAVKL